MEAIKEYLTRLDLNPNRLPTVKEYKKAYREKLKNHPDKGGDTVVFQGITEAAMAVWQYMVENQDTQTRPETEKDSALLKNFENTNNVHYNKGNVVFDIDGKKAQLWIDCLQKRVGPPVTLADGSGVKMKTDHFKIPLVTCKTKHEYGSLSVTVYPNPKTSHPKIMIQGQAYLAFVTLVLPEVVKDMISPRLGLTTDVDIAVSDCDSEAESLLDRNRKLSVPASNSLTPNITEDNSVDMLHAFQRLENELVTIRTSLSTKVDTAIAHIAKLSVAGLDSKIDNLENLLNSNLKQTKELAQAVNDLSSSMTTNSAIIDASHIDDIAQRVSNHPTLTQLTTTLSTMRGEVAKTTYLEGVMTEIQGISVSLNTLGTQVNNVSKTLNEANEASNKDMAQIRKNSDNSQGMFLAMKTSLETLVQQAANPNNTNRVTSLPNNDTTKSNVAQDNPETKTYKGIIFTDSVAQEIDIKKLKEDINCDLKVIPTKYIQHHADTTDPDEYLQCMVSQHLAGKTGYDFAVIATGSNDITELDVKNSPPTTLTNAVADQTKTLVEVAETLAAENNIDIFLIDKPPRYDPASNDPTSMYPKLAKYSNGVLASSVGMTPRLIIVDQSSLARSSIKARSEVYRPDGINLTTKGLNFFTSNLIKALTECYTDMAITRQATRPSNGTGGPDRGGRGGSSDNTGGGNRQDRRYADRRDRQHFAYPGGQHYYAPYPDYPPPPPPHTGWAGSSDNWGGARQRQRNPRQGHYRDSDYGSYAGYSGGHNRGFRRN